MRVSDKRKIKKNKKFNRKVVKRKQRVIGTSFVKDKNQFVCSLFVFLRMSRAQ